MQTQYKQLLVLPLVLRVNAAIQLIQGRSQFTLSLQFHFR